MNTETKILLAFVLADDITLTPSEMDKRGIPLEIRPERSPAMVAKMLGLGGGLPAGPLQGFTVKGNASDGYELKDTTGKPVATIKANGVFDLVWDGKAIEQWVITGQLPAANAQATLQAASAWLKAYVEDIQNSLDRATVRRMFLGWIKQIGFEATGIPSLYEGPLTIRPEMEKIIAALPEAEWTTWEAREFF